jgi:hypothetical protein
MIGLIEALAEIQIPRQQPASDTCPLCGKQFSECQYFQSLTKKSQKE